MRVNRIGMNYQVLARKWRPKTFEQLMGQEHVVTVLVNALTQNRLHHAYLFTGTRGVGKTTIARIFAKSLNCEMGVTATPCGVCDVCIDIDDGRFIDLLEIDAASRTKVDDTREILDNVQYAPTRGRYKVYLIDEVHMLSRSSFNALLKTLEEPPEHVKFILATTDPQKLPITVLSRCLQFHLKALTVKQIEEKLRQILSAENVSHEKGALTLLAKAARGSMRDSLSLTDQAIAQGQGNISFANLQQMLGGIDQNWVYKILIALLKQDSIAVMSLSQEIASYAPNYNRLFAEFIQLFHQIAMFQVVKKHLDLAVEHAALIDKFSRAMSPEDIQLYYQIALNGRKDLPYAADEQAAFDMVLLRMMAFKPMQISDVEYTQAHSQRNMLESFEEIELSDTLVSIEDSFIIEEKNAETVSVASNHVIITQEVSNQTINNNNVNEELVDIGQDQIVPDVDLAPTLSFEDSFNHVALDLPISKYESDDFEPLDESHINISANMSQPIEQVPSSLNENVRTPVEDILATRNMLRSRKKQLEKSPKKSNDATMRHASKINDIESQQSSKNNTIENSTPENSTPENSVPALATLPQQPFNPEIIDPANVKLANQVDKWANMIDAMGLTGRLRQLAIHATIDENSTDDRLILKLDQATKHLITDNAYKQLEIFMCEYLKRTISVEIIVVEKTIADPFQIQSHINDKRYDYAKEVLLTDEVVVALINNFQATIDDSTIVAL